jgi:hypothetical protein
LKPENGGRILLSETFVAISLILHNILFQESVICKRVNVREAGCEKGR